RGHGWSPSSSPDDLRGPGGRAADRLVRALPRGELPTRIQGSLPDRLLETRPLLPTRRPGAARGTATPGPAGRGRGPVPPPAAAPGPGQADAARRRERPPGAAAATPPGPPPDPRGTGPERLPI